MVTNPASAPVARDHGAKVNPAALPLYRLPELLAMPADTAVFFTEGEKACDAVRAHGLKAVALGGGAGQREFGAALEPLSGRTVYLLPDNDEPGSTYMRAVSAALLSVDAIPTTLILPDQPAKGGAAEWLAAGGTADQILDLARQSQPDPRTLPAPVPAVTTPQPARSQVSRLIQLAEGADLFHAQDGKAYITVPINGHRETYAVREKATRQWLGRLYYMTDGTAASTQATQDALEVLTAKALYDGPERAVHLRVARHEGGIYVDLCNEQWECVEVDDSGWRVLAEPPIRFRRPKGATALPTPTRGGSIATLRPFLNVGTDEDFILVASWLLGALQPEGPFPILGINGEQGSGKSTTTKLLRSLIDPATSPLRSLSRDERDLMIGAANNWCLAFDNLSGLKPETSDSLCRLATGGGFATRELWADSDETVLSATRPMILNGIADLGERPDLLERSLLIALPRITGGGRRTERDVWQDFGGKQAGILGALYDGVSRAIRDVGAVSLAALPRMADFAQWSVAGASAFGWTGADFLNAYQGNQEGAHELALDASPIGAAMTGFARTMRRWEGTATELLDQLNAARNDEARQTRAWTSNAASLSIALKRIVPDLRAMGIEVEMGMRVPGKGTRLIRIEQRGK